MKIKKNAKPIQSTDDFYYNLFLGGYIKPKDFLEDEDLSKVEEAIETINQFNDALESEGLIEEM